VYQDTVIADQAPHFAWREKTGTPPAGLRLEALKLSFHNDPHSIAAQWRELEAHGVATPYQRLDFLKAWQSTLGEAQAVRGLIVVASTSDGTPVALFPFGLVKRFGARIASFLGGKHANFNMPLFRPGLWPNLTQDQAQALLRRIALESGTVDAFLLLNQPENWNGHPNPLIGTASSTSISPAYRSRLEADGETFLERQLSPEARKKMRRKERLLASIGPVQLVRPQGEAERRAALAAFLAQKSARFGEKAMHNPFETPAAKAFLECICIGETDTASIDLFVLNVAEQPAAIFAGIAHQGRFSATFTSFAMEERLMKASPGDVLLARMLSELCREGYTHFDLGVGEARYKTTYCNEDEPLFDSIHGITIHGKAVAGLLRAECAAKGWLKRHPAVLKRLMLFQR
jgi:CelD/BcsL family acetyltransferase involved in cellulose biosynthesis